MGFRLQQKLILNDLERQFTALSSVMRVVTKRLKLESRGFRYKVALYHTSATVYHIKFEYKIKGNESLRISSIISDYPASKVKLTSMLRCIYRLVKSLLLDTSVTVTKAHRVNASVGLYTETAKAQTTLYAMGRQCCLYYVHIHNSVSTP